MWTKHYKGVMKSAAVHGEPRRAIEDATTIMEITPLMRGEPELLFRGCYLVLSARTDGLQYHACPQFKCEQNGVSILRMHMGHIPE